MTTPTDIVNRALDQMGRSDLTMGDITEGSTAAQPALRAYGPAWRQLSRAAHWTFNRKVAPLTLLADATGQTAGAGSVVIAPWVYEYAYPIDCLQMRFVPQNYLNPNQSVDGNIALPATPQTTVTQPPLGYGMRLIPSPFLLSTDTNYPVDASSNWENVIGQTPSGRLVVLSNVKQANAVYTAEVPYPQLWDALFEQTMVELLVARLSMSLAKDVKFGATLQERAVGRIKSALDTARAASANESGFPHTTDNVPDFIRGRQSGMSGMGGGGPWDAANYSGMGQLYCGWSGLGLGNGSIY